MNVQRSKASFAAAGGRKAKLRDPRFDGLPPRAREFALIIDRLGAATARDIEKQLPNPISYSGVRGMLRRLVKKGVVECRGVGRPQSFLYVVPGADRGSMEALRKTVDEHFQGSTLSAALAILDLLERDGASAIVAMELTRAGHRSAGHERKRIR